MRLVSIAKESNDETGCVNRMIHCRTEAIAWKALYSVALRVGSFVTGLKRCWSERSAGGTIGIIAAKLWKPLWRFNGKRAVGLVIRCCTGSPIFLALYQSPEISVQRLGVDVAVARNGA